MRNEWEPTLPWGPFSTFQEVALSFPQSNGEATRWTSDLWGSGYKETLTLWQRHIDPHVTGPLLASPPLNLAPPPPMPSGREGGPYNSWGTCTEHCPICPQPASLESYSLQLWLGTLATARTGSKGIYRSNCPQPGGVFSGGDGGGSMARSVRTLKGHRSGGRSWPQAPTSSSSGEDRGALRGVAPVPDFLGSHSWR